ncbi:MULTISPECIES: hypothetical protein [Rhodanobacter]|uniref:Uncharacterized protein n=1 Tax=Rhodanobacter sp. IGA1.0 TaxID=3158582 RepID=A0AAU7QM21_9GAMM|nr:hypothetical protein [Rhodanobacter spathiphylli]
MRSEAFNRQGQQARDAGEAAWQSASGCGCADLVNFPVPFVEQLRLFASGGRKTWPNLHCLARWTSAIQIPATPSLPAV